MREWCLSGRPISTVANRHALPFVSITSLCKPHLGTSSSLWVQVYQSYIRLTGLLGSALHRSSRRFSFSCEGQSHQAYRCINLTHSTALPSPSAAAQARHLRATRLTLVIRSSPIHLLITGILASLNILKCISRPLYIHTLDGEDEEANGLNKSLIIVALIAQKALALSTPTRELSSCWSTPDKPFDCAYSASRRDSSQTSN